MAAWVKKQWRRLVHGATTNAPSEPVEKPPEEADLRGPIEALCDPDWERAKEAARRLGRAGDPQAVDALAQALAGVDLDIRREAAEALGKLGSARAVQPLTVALTDSRTHAERHAPLQICASNADARIEAARALGEIGDPRAIDALKSVKHLQLHGLYRGCTLAEAAAAALEKLGAVSGEDVESPGEERMIEALTSPFSGDRERAIKAVEDGGEDRSDNLDRAYRASCKMRDAMNSRGPTQQRLVEDAIELAPSFSPAMQLLSNIHQYEHRALDQALEWATRAVAADTGNWLAWIQLGRVHVEMGNAVEATRSFAESVRINPEVEGGLRSEPYAYLLPVYEKLRMTPEGDDATNRIREGGTRLDDNAELDWRTLVAGAPVDALRDALTGK